MIDRSDPIQLQIQSRAKVVSCGAQLGVQNTQLAIATADTAAIVYSAAVGHAVAAGAGGVAAPAHAARVQGLVAKRNAIASHTCVTATAHIAAIDDLSAVGHAVAARASRVISSTFAAIIRFIPHSDVEVNFSGLIGLIIQKRFDLVSAIDGKIPFRIARAGAGNDK